MGYKAAFRVWRGDDQDGELQDFTVEVNEGEVVLDVIHRLQATQAGDLAVRWNCKAGKCGSCSAEINGRPRLMCMTRMNTYSEDETVTVTPLRTFPVIKDLVTDVSFNYAKAREIPAFAPPEGVAPGDYRMQQVDVERSQEFRKCIECFLCQNTCHVIRDHEDNKESFAGPRFFIRLAELDMHPLDAADRRKSAQEQHGLGLCNITKCCTEVCPEHIKITDNGIIPMKERVVDTKYDPVIFLGSRIPRRGAGEAAKHLDAGDAVGAEKAARARLATRPKDPAALGTLEDALVAQGRFAEAADVTRAQLDRIGTGRFSQTARMHALNNHAWALLCAVEAGQADLDEHDDAITTALEDAQQIASTGTTLAGTHALNSLVHGNLADAEAQARDALAWDRDSKSRSDDLLTLSEALAGLGETAAAASALAESRQLWPSNPRLAGATANLGEVGVSASP
jgi:succinate dehydrogenase iron-sulfur subunit